MTGLEKPTLFGCGDLAGVFAGVSILGSPHKGLWNAPSAGPVKSAGHSSEIHSPYVVSRRDV